MEGLLLGLLFVLAGAAELWLAWLGSQRRLAPGSFVGVRLPATRRSDAAWYAAQEATAGPYGVGGGVGAVCGLALCTTGLDTIGVVVAAVAAVALLSGASGATVMALRAARAVPERSDGPDHGG
jgi:hypothetical protein